MKTLLSVITSFLLSGSVMASNCLVEIDGKKLEPQVLKVNTATILNRQPDQAMVVITCEPFKGEISGAASIIRLSPGGCTLVSQKSGPTLISCEK